MEYEVKVKKGLEWNFRYVLRSFDTNAKILSSNPNFTVETSTSQNDIESWTMVMEVTAKRPSLVFGSANLGYNSGWVGGQANVGNIVGSGNHTIVAGSSGLVSLNMVGTNFSSLLANFAMCSDLSMVSVENTQSGITYGLLKLVPSPHEVRVQISTSNSPSILTLGDFRAIYNSVFLTAPVVFDSGAITMMGTFMSLPVKSSKHKNVNGITNIVLEV